MKKIKFSVLEENLAFKVLCSKPLKGTSMTKHFADKEAFILVQEGEILFELGSEQHLMTKGIGIKIPKDVVHAFDVLEDSEVLLILDRQTKLQFCRDEIEKG